MSLLRELKNASAAGTLPGFLLARGLSPEWAQMVMGAAGFALL